MKRIFNFEQLYATTWQTQRAYNFLCNWL